MIHNNKKTIQLVRPKHFNYISSFWIGMKNKEPVLGTKYAGSNTTALWLDNAYYIFYNFIIS
jgi:hypothetical protein